MKDTHQAEKKYLEAMGWLEKNNDFAEAQKMFLSLVEEFPDFPNSYALLGYIYSSKLNNPVKADYYFKQGLETDATHLPTYYNYSSFLQNESRHDELEKLLKKMQMMPGISLGDVYIQYGLMREYQKRYGEAIQYFKSALRETTNPDLFNVCNNGITRSKLKRFPWVFKVGPNNAVVLRIIPLFSAFAIFWILVAILIDLVSN